MPALPTWTGAVASIHPRFLAFLRVLCTIASRTADSNCGETAVFPRSLLDPVVQTTEQLVRVLRYLVGKTLAVARFAIARLVDLLSFGKPGSRLEALHSAL